MIVGPLPVLSAGSPLPSAYCRSLLTSFTVTGSATFSSKFTVPSAPVGSHTVSAVVGGTTEAQSTFTLTGSSPTATIVPTSTPVPPTATPTTTTPVTSTHPTPTPTPVSATASGSFTIQGTQIVDPSGKVFRVKGVDAVYGRFDGGDANGYGLTNYTNAQSDLAFLKSQGINLVRVSVSADKANVGPSDPNYIGGYATYMTELDNVVNWATSRGLVVELSQGETTTFTTALSFVGTLAARYASNHLVWIKPDNEPNCETGNGNSAYCDDWTTWQSEEQQYVTAIRNHGNTNPIVLNCIDWSWDCSQIARYPINDPLHALVYGPHRYNDGLTSFTSSDQSDCDQKWANLSSQYPMIVDEVGADDGYPISLTWNQGFLAYATNWTLNRGGDGVIAFTGHWSDGNDLYDSLPQVWTPWGTIFATGYLQKT